MTIRFALLSAVFVACATQAGAGTVALQSDGVALAIETVATRVQSAPVIGSHADLSLEPLDGLKTDFRFGAETGVRAAYDAVSFASPWIAPTASDRWSTGRFGLGADWSLSPVARLELVADDQVRHEVDRTVANWTQSDDQRVFTHTADARAGLILSPTAPLNLRLNGEAIDAGVQTINLAGATAGIDTLRTRTGRTSAALQWKPFSKLSLEGGGQLESIGVSWYGAGATTAGARADDYAFVEPRVTAGLTPWDGASLKLGVERAVSPIRKDQFIAFAQVADRTAGPAFAPDQEWRYQASWQEDLGDGIAFNAAYTHGKLINATDLGPIGTSQAPMSIGAGQRDQVQAGFAAPLTLPGLLPPLTLKASASWRNSRVQDPFTGAARRLSGETPYDAELTLSPQPTNAVVRWGLSARASGAATTYQMAQTTTQQVGAGLGGFLEYRPGPVAVQLRLDNLVGGDLTERDVYFAGSRDANMIDRVSETHTSNRVFMLSLVRPL